MSDYETLDWFCVLNGARIGPMSWDLLRERIRRGQLQPADWVWVAPFGASWRPAGTIDGLFPTPPPPPPATPPPPPAPEPSPDVAPSAAAPGLHLEAASVPSARRAFRAIWRSMVRTLFQPFDLARWFSIGFCAWLATLGGGGPNLQGLVDTEALQARLAADPATTFSFSLLTDHFSRLLAKPLLTAAMLSAVLMGLLFALLFCWLRARGSFMFLHRIENPQATIRQAWQVASHTALPLFWWRLSLGFAGWVALLAIGAGAVVSLGVDVLRSGNWSAIGAAVTLPWAAVWGGALALLLCVWGTVSSLSFHFMEPLLYCHRDGIAPAWRRVWALCRDYPFAVLRFYLVLTLFLIAATLAMLLFIFGSCCLGLVLMILPLVGAVVLLPLLWLHRGFGVAFLKQIRTE
jgi:hypothetical protein